VTDLQRDIELIDELVLSGAYGLVDGAPEAWQRIKASLTPDLERVARAMYESAMIPGDYAWEDQSTEKRNRWRQLAGAAIDAMVEP
jgi:hypothetical protein